MAKVHSTIEIATPPEKVWNVVMDPSRLQDWVTIHRRIDDVSDRPLREGSHMRQTMCLRGVNFHVRWRVAELRRPELTVWEGRGPARSRALIRQELHALDGGRRTRFAYLNEFTPPGGPVGAVASRVLVGGISEREARLSLQRLRQIVEG
jgi:uncharacterized protein YndB with AHSA1/START domain